MQYTAYQKMASLICLKKLLSPPADFFSLIIFIVTGKKVGHGRYKFYPKHRG